MSDEYGGGIYLSSENDIGPKWDMKIDNSGDIKTVTGEAELQKDVAYSTTIRVLPELGGRIEPVVLNRIEARIRDALEDEDRINNILIIDVTDIGNDTVQIVSQVNADNETIELVFEV